MRSLAVVAPGPVLRAALEAQSFTEWEIAPAMEKPARSYLLSVDDEALAKALSTRGMLLYYMIRMEIDLLGLLVLESSAGGYAGAILAHSAFEYHVHVPRRSSLIVDLIEHARSVGIRVGSIIVTDVPIAQPTESSGPAWRAGIPAGNNDSSLPAKPDLFTCSTNDLYGSAAVMRAYCGVREMLPIVGRLQHGWEPGPGIVLEATDDAGFDRYYVWTALALDRLKLMRVHEPDIADSVRRTELIRERLSRVKLIPIGASYLYLPDLPDCGPIGKDWLLAIPGHGIAASTNRVHPWADYLLAVSQFAKEHGFSHTTVLVYAEDDNPAARQAIAEASMHPATCGRVGDITYMLKVRSFIRQHAAVTSDRVCTAGMYALYENRPFHIAGAGTVVHEPPDAYAELVADPIWIAQNYPGIWAGGLEGRNEALRELGTKLSPEVLRRTLYYWIWE